MNNRIDPAALFLAVLVAIVGPMVTDGPWELLDSILAAVVASILWCFTWPARNALVSIRLATAHALAYGFIVGTGLAWGVQAFLWPSELEACSRWIPSLDDSCYAARLQVQLEVVASGATLFALLLGLLVAVGIFLYLSTTRMQTEEAPSLKVVATQLRMRGFAWVRTVHVDIRAESSSVTSSSGLRAGTPGSDLTRKSWARSVFAQRNRREQLFGREERIGDN